MSMIIDLSGGADNAFHSVEVLLGGELSTLRLSYATSLQAWAMDIIQDGAPVYAGIMLHSNADMLASWNVRDTFGAMTLIGDEPTIDNLGDACLLVWTSPDEL